MNVTEG